jgi:hypothetical protein
MTLIPFSIFVMPITMRRLKIRSRHVARVAVYGLFIPIFVLSTCELVEGWALAVRSASVAPHYAAIWLARITPLLIVCWWWIALWRYMKVPHAWFTAMVLGTMCSLLILGGVWLMWPQVLIDADVTSFVEWLSGA